MGKIRLTKIDHGGMRHQLSMVLRAKQYRINSGIQAVFDTGCPHALVISEGEARKLHMPFSSMSKGDSVVGLGTQKYETFVVKNAELTLRDVDSKPVNLTLPTTYILKCTKRSQKALTEAYNSPNLIGLEFLSAAKFTLQTDTDGNMFFETA